MARVKRVITQRDFSAGELREEFLDRDDVEVRQASLKHAKNVFINTSQTLQARPGSIYRGEQLTARHMIELRPTSNLTYLLLLMDNRIRVVDETGATVFETGSVAWTNAELVWAVNLGRQTVIGHPAHGIYLLAHSGAGFTYGNFTFAAGPGSSILQPYLKITQAGRIQPSGRTGSITITAPDDVFNALMVGTRIRYGGREIQITSVTDSMNAAGTVISALPPSYRLTVASTSNLFVGDVVIGQDSGFQGVITSIDSATTFSVLTLENWDGPDTAGTEPLSSPQVTQDVTAKTSISPVLSSFWDEQLFSPWRGYPRSAEFAAGRLWFADIDIARNLVVASSVRAPNDFELGVDDDDAIMRTIGAEGTNIRHVVDSGDILFMSDRGLFYQDRRSNGLLTPSNFAPIRFDERGCSAVRPVRVERGVVFVEEGRKSVAAALLDGNVYLTWTVLPLSLYAPHLFKNPVALCGPPLSRTEADRMLLVINSDGTAAAMSWSAEFGQERVGFVPWETNGLYETACPAFGKYWAIVTRQSNNSDGRLLEEFDFGAFMDCTRTVDPTSNTAAGYLSQQTVHVMSGNNCIGSSYVIAGGRLEETFPDAPPTVEVGLNFTCEANVWPVDLIDVPYAGLKRARCFYLIVSVMDTRDLTVRCNNHTRGLGSYEVGDDLSLPPALRTKVYRIPVFGRRDHSDLAVLRTIPGPWRILSIAQEVQA